MAELQFGPLTDDLASQSVEHENTVTTPGEVLGETVSQGIDALPTFAMSRSAAREARSGVAPTTNYTGDMSYDPENENLPHKPTVTMDPTDANMAIDQAGAKGMAPFTQPTDPGVVKSLISDHLDRLKSADVIERNGSAILSGQVARFGVGALLSLVDPLNDAALMFPVVPEAFAAEKLAAAGSVIARTAVRAGVGATEGAVGMSALEPLNYLRANQDHEDWSAGEALRNIAFGAALGAGGHAILGGLLGRMEPEDREAALRASVADVMHDNPVDVAPILKAAELRAAEKSRPSAFDPAAADLLPPDHVPPFSESHVIAALDPEARARFDAVETQLADPALTPEDRAPLAAERETILDAGEPAAIDKLRGDAQASAQGAVERATHPAPDPEITAAERSNQHTIDTAPVLEGVADKDLAEVNAMLADQKSSYAAAVENGAIAEHPTLSEVGADIENEGKAAANYAACFITRGI